MISIQLASSYISLIGKVFAPISTDNGSKVIVYHYPKRKFKSCPSHQFSLRSVKNCRDEYLLSIYSPYRSNLTRETINKTKFYRYGNFLIEKRSSATANYAELVSFKHVKHLVKRDDKTHKSIKNNLSSYLEWPSCFNNTLSQGIMSRITCEKDGGYYESKRKGLVDKLVSSDQGIEQNAQWLLVSVSCGM